MDLVTQEYMIRKLIDMFKEQEMLLTHLRTRVRVNWKGEMTIYEVAGMDLKIPTSEDTFDEAGNYFIQN